MKGIRGKLAKGAFWTLASRVLVNIVSLLSTLLLARLLTPEDFGLVAIATALLEMVSAASNLSLGNALIRHADPTDDHFHTTWTLSIIRSAAIGGILAIAAWPVAFFYGDGRLVPIMLALASSVMITGFANPKLIVFSRNLVFSQDFFLQVSQKASAFIISLILALIYHSYWALVFGVIASQVTYLIVSYMLLPHRPRLGLKHWRELFSFSIWMTLQDLLYTVGWGLDNLLIGGVVGRPALGHFSVGSNLAATPMREAGLSITKLLFPGLARVMLDPARIKSAYTSAQALLTAVILPVGVGIALCARPAVMAFMSAKWLPVIPVIQGLSVIMALQALGMLAKPLAMAKGVTRLLFQRNLANFVISVPLSIAGLWLGGLNGIVIARLVSGLVAIGFNLYLVRQLISLSITQQLASNGRSLVSTMTMAVGAFSLQSLGHAVPLTVELVSTIVVGGTLYVATHYLLWAASGKGEGPERELMAFADKMVAVLRARRAMH